MQGQINAGCRPLHGTNNIATATINNNFLVRYSIIITRHRKLYTVREKDERDG
ncbi:hypothetical protein DEO72_LG3g3246 [Vigna unguiculata]|uniref:Uncharacterized protein n=1 Tax=Vigna unguiculata TaxID=3917 RepID=A0A4D6LK42_VIGUN|nr:hypothetical protein DEO72_LG3g3246 [Vigna unguiculata]